MKWNNFNSKEKHLAFLDVSGEKATNKFCMTL